MMTNIAPIPARLLIAAWAICLTLTAKAQSNPPFLGVDENSNRVSDVYEALNPGLGSPTADDDADGMTNEQEAAAGTNARSGSEILTFSTLTNNGVQIEGSWSSVPGKLYQIQAANILGGTWANEGAAVMGDGNVKTASIPVAGERTFLRIKVTDTDSDGDGATDWEEIKTGTDRYLFDSDGDDRSDSEVVKSLLSSASTVAVYAADSWASEVGPRPGVFRIVRRGGFLPVTVSFVIGGTASKGEDYTLSGTHVVLPAGAVSATVSVIPVVDAIMEEAETVVLALEPGAGYALAPESSATINIAGQGLIGQYFDTSNGTYNSPLNFDPAQLKLTRRDATLDFDWGAGAPPTGITDDNVWGAKWTGVIIPRYSELYRIHAIVDRGVVVWVSDSPINPPVGDVTGARINVWTTTDPTTVNSANALPSSALMVAGKPYYVRIDYRDTAGFPDNANIQLRWSSASQTEEVIPADRILSEGYGTLPPVISSPLATAGIVGAPFAYQITATNAPASFTASGLPAGLSVNQGTGLISGTSSAAAGYYFTTITASNAAGTDAKNLIVWLTATGGSITRDVWTGLSGAGVQSIPVHTAPTTSGSLTSFESPYDFSDHYGERVRGYLTAPVTGNYTFFVTSDENAELWVSASDEPGRRLKRAWVSGGGAGETVWDAQPTQKSLSVRMFSGRQYYIEALRRESTGPDHLAVAWLKPGQTDPAQKEIIPAWALTAWTPPVASNQDGTLYAATLAPESGSVTLGSGMALLHVNAAKTDAALSFTYSNLTGPVNSGQHIHDARTITGQAGRIMYDIDDFQPDPYGVRPWSFEPSGSHSVADMIAAVETGNAYINLHTTAYPNGEIKGTFYPVSGSQFFTPPPSPPAAELSIPSDPSEAKREAVRFLQQATYGAKHDANGLPPWDPDSIEAVQAMGYAAWIDNQIAMPAGPDPETLNIVQVPPTQVFETADSGRQTPNSLVNTYNGSGPFASWISDYYRRYPRSSVDGTDTQASDELWRVWWQTAIQSQNQLRHRVAFALSQILVVSEDGALEGNSRAVGHYYDLLYYHGLGNFRTLLERVTLNPSMGRYLDMRGNKKPNLATGYIPNENYAREILQLFSIGLKRLHPDGSMVLDSDGLPLSTYDQDVVVGFAHTFTGWNDPGSSNNYITAMVPRPNDHAIGEKLLLENAVIPAATGPTVDSCNAELAQALDLIFHHPNTGPFIARQLIQRMVTANPSTGYIYRAASAFHDNGSGVRGDLAAVVRAILLDPEARNATPRTANGYGHLKEPVIRVTQLLRAFRGFSYAERTWGYVEDLGACIVSSQANIDLSLPLPTTDVTIGGVIRPLTIVDGFVIGGVNAAATPVAFGVGNAILVRNQTNPAENGVYLFNGNGQLLTRPSYADEPAELSGAWVRVVAGTNEDKSFRQSAAITTVGTDPQTWEQQTIHNPRRRLWEMGTTGGSALSQTPLRAPTVFNFYEPDYVFLGNTGVAGLYAPEFQITNENSVINAGNWMNDLVRHNGTDTASPFSYGQGYSHSDAIKRDIKMDLTFERTNAADSGALVDHIAALVMPGQLPPRLRALLVNYLETLQEGTDAQRMVRVGEAFYLLSLTPEFATQK